MNNASSSPIILIQMMFVTCIHKEHSVTNGLHVNIISLSNKVTKLHMPVGLVIMSQFIKDNTLPCGLQMNMLIYVLIYHVYCIKNSNVEKYYMNDICIQCVILVLALLLLLTDVQCQANSWNAMSCHGLHVIADQCPQRADHNNVVSNPSFLYRDKRNSPKPLSKLNNDFSWSYT